MQTVYRIFFSEIQIIHEFHKNHRNAFQRKSKIYMFFKSSKMQTVNRKKINFEKTYFYTRRRASPRILTRLPARVVLLSQGNEP